MRMARLDPEARVAIRTLVSHGTSNSAIARLLDVTEGAVRYQVARMSSGRIDGRLAKIPKASCVAAAIDFWRESEGAGPINLAALHDWLVREHGYGGSLRRCSGSGPSAILHRRSGRRGGWRRRRGPRPRWTGRISRP
jgi:hypothetical protein